MTLKRLCCHLWTENETKITELQLNMLVRMLKTPNFSTRMNALQVGGHANRLANRSFAPSANESVLALAAHRVLVEHLLVLNFEFVCFLVCRTSPDRPCLIPASV